MLPYRLVVVAAYCALAALLIPAHAAYDLVQAPVKAADHDADIYFYAPVLSGDGSTWVTYDMLPFHLSGVFSTNLVVFDKNAQTKKWARKHVIAMPDEHKDIGLLAIDHKGKTIGMVIAPYEESTFVIYTKSEGEWSFSSSFKPPFIDGHQLSHIIRHIALSNDGNTLITGFSINHAVASTAVGPLLAYRRLANGTWEMEGYIFKDRAMSGGAWFNMSPDARTIVATIIDSFDIRVTRCFAKASTGVWTEYSLPIQLLRPYSDLNIINLVQNGKYMFVHMYNDSDVGVLYRNDNDLTFDPIFRTNLTIPNYVLNRELRPTVNEEMTVMIHSETNHVMDAEKQDIKGIVIPFHVVKTPTGNDVFDFQFVPMLPPMVAEKTQSEDVIDTYGSAVLVSDDASTLVVMTRADDYTVSTLFFYEGDGHVLVPSKAPTTKNCRRPANADQKQCLALKKRCPKSNVKWVKKACGSYDKGCRCKGFCKHRCKSGCTADPQCKWKNGKCYDKKTNTLWGVNNCFA